MKLDEAIKLSDHVRALTTQLLDAITEAIEEDPAPAPVVEARPAGRLSVHGKYRARIAEGEAVAVEMDAIVRSHGWTVTESRGHRINCVEAIERSFRHDPVAFDAALWCLTSAFGYHPATVDGRLIEGVTVLLHRHAGEIQRVPLAEHLRTQWTAVGILDIVKRRRHEALGGVAPPPRSMEFVAQVLAASYGER